MEVYGIGIVIPSILPPTIVTTLVFLTMKVLKCLWMIKYVDLGLLRPSTLPLEITDFIIVVTMVEVDLGLKILATLSLEIVEFITLVLMVEVELGLKRQATILLEIMEQELMLTGEVGIGTITATLTPKTQVAVVDC